MKVDFPIRARIQHSATATKNQNRGKACEFAILEHAIQPEVPFAARAAHNLMTTPLLPEQIELQSRPHMSAGRTPPR